MCRPLQETSIVIRKIEACRSCDSKRLVPILNLGELYVSDFVNSEGKRGKAPLELVLCEDCNLLQLKHTVNPELLYREYWYKSGINETIRRDLKDIATKVERSVKLKSGDLVLDIGCNDGTILRMYKTEGLRSVGFEPAVNLIREASKGTTKIINDFFSLEVFQKSFSDEKAKVITAIAMFYDLDKPGEFVSDVSECLDKNGVFVIEQRYLFSMLEQNDIGNICHEHIEYYGLLSLRKLLEQYGLEIFDVELNKVNGGSFRVYVRHVGSRVKSFDGAEERVRRLETHERSLSLDDRKIYKDFASRVESIKSRLYSFIKAEHDRGKAIHVYGASTKGNTMLQYFGLDNRLIEAAAERDHRKVGKKTVVTQIPIITEEESRRSADYFLVLPWHFLDVFLKREEKFLMSGGKFIVPLPEFRVLGYKEALEEWRHTTNSWRSEIPEVMPALE
jgi:NDP-4-keto-2,6-dideoxyhexose 3-C-methyltransferase